MLALEVVGYLLAVNALTFGLFAIDKHQAQTAGWRTSERNLLFAALAGGSAGAKFAQRRLAHKTRKEPFRTLLNGIVALHLVVAVALTSTPLRQRVLDGFGAVSGSD